MILWNISVLFIFNVSLALLLNFYDKGKDNKFKLLFLGVIIGESFSLSG